MEVVGSIEGKNNPMKYFSILKQAINIENLGGDKNPKRASPKKSRVVIAGTNRGYRPQIQITDFGKPLL